MSDHDADSAAIDAENAAYAVADVANDADAFAEDDTYMLMMMLMLELVYW